jgi:c-di-AMP phosphodiesterase-like protein
MAIIEEQTLSRLRVASEKGGNIIAVDANGNNYFIGVSAAAFKENQTVQNAFLHKLIEERVKKSRNVIVTTHKFADVDALASTLAVVELIKTFKKPVKFYIDTFDQTAKLMYIQLMAEEFDQYKIKLSEFNKELTKNTLIIILDTMNANRVQFNPGDYNKILKENILVIDHHRQSGEVIETTPNGIYLDIHTSSVSEIITEQL